MTVTETDSTYDRLTLLLLEAIPRSDSSASSLQEICRKTRADLEACEQAILTVIALLQVFDALTIEAADAVTDTRIKSRSATADYFLNSLTDYVSKGYHLVSNWERAGVGHDLSVEHVFDSGAQFVFLMEQKRTVEYEDQRPLSHTSISQAIIKAKIRGRSEPSYLIQYDQRARQYQFIGGHMRSTDSDALTVMQREIEEELPYSQLKYHRDYELVELVSSLVHKRLSHTYGIHTEYDFTIYHAVFKKAQLVLGPNDRWVRQSELFSGQTKDGTPILVDHIEEVDQALLNGLKGLSLSLDSVQVRPIREVIKDRRWELLGIAIGVVGVLATIIVYLLGNIS